jgi:hypothetical protein
MSYNYKSLQNNYGNKVFKSDLLNSNKSDLNKSIDETNTLDKNIFELNNSSTFLSSINKKYMSIYVLKLFNKNNCCGAMPEFIKNVPLYMDEWVDSEDINSYEFAFPDWIQLLDFLNMKFLKKYNFLYENTSANQDFADSNVFKLTMPVTYNNQTQLKQYSHLTADDIRNIDVWQKQDTVRSNGNFRYNNKIPFWQCTMNIRHYDRDSDGLHNIDADQASLETHVRGYDMSSIMKTI